MAYSLKEINFRTVSDPKGLIEEGDEQYLRKVEKAADLIVENRKNSPIVLLSGPSGSGKTTTSMKIAEALKKRGVARLKVVYSRETPISHAEGIDCIAPEGCRQTPGSTAFCPSVAGLILASEVVRDLLKAPQNISENRSICTHE